ncbi:MAG TPA: alpha-L-fucosidase, partial [Blastocatellia bacterium]|nr:alpha-L-fucosidase [Blastocatellia bacterium]
MTIDQLTRRDYLKLMGAGAAVAASTLSTNAGSPALETSDEKSDRARRMQWWHEAKFGMFIHWGLYSVLGRHEWVMENEGVSVAEYEQLAKRFNPKPNAARDWAKLARRAGQKYMVMTTKHHEGFCHFNTATTNYCAPKQAAGRD